MAIVDHTGSNERRPAALFFDARRILHKGARSSSSFTSERLYDFSPAVLHQPTCASASPPSYAAPPLSCELEI
jgi:hypothetical protein